MGTYLAYPETSSTAWYPEVGIALVAIPWAFWLMTFMYRCCLKREIGDQRAVGMPPKGGVTKQASLVGSGATASGTSPEDSPGDDEAWKVGVEPQEGQRRSVGNRSLKEGDSHNSNESEIPLALSMSPS